MYCVKLLVNRYLLDKSKQSKIVFMFEDYEGVSDSNGLEQFSDSKSIDERNFIFVHNMISYASTIYLQRYTFSKYETSFSPFFFSIQSISPQTATSTGAGALGRLTHSYTRNTDWKETRLTLSKE